MGAIISMFSSGAGGISVDIDVDFVNAAPTAEEKEVWDVVQALLERRGPILEKLTVYKGCGNKIREAINSPTPENEDAAWEAILPAVDQLKEFYDYSNELTNQGFIPLLQKLATDTPKESIASKQALAKQMAQLFDFVIRFDDLKMVNPAIQNDFSYYRRSLNRMKVKNAKNTSAPELVIKDELANRMSLFYAYPTPMMNNLISEATQNVQGPSTLMTLAIMTMVCEQMVREKSANDAEVNMFCLRCMVGTAILYDHMHPQGVFRKGSDVNMKQCIGTLKAQEGEEKNALLNVLRFTSAHLNDPETPNTIKAMLE